MARLAHEQKMLEHLAGLGCVPALYGRVRHWEHHFLVEELVEGETLQEAVGRRHPLFRDGADESDVAAYTLWALGVIGRVEEAVAALHARGVVFGDLQPGNIMVRPDDSVCLVDFETAFAEADDHRPALGTPGFTARWARSGRSVDAYGLAAVSLALFCPLTPLLRFDRDKYVQLTDWTRGRFPVRPEFTAALRERLAPPPHWPRADDDVPPDGSPWPETPGADVGPALDSLAEAIRLSATPEREDRLFPGDVRQFDNQGASLAFGAAGVLHALLVCGYGEDPAFEGAFEEYVDWLARAAERTRWPRPGLYDGLAGVAYVLDELGRTDQGRAALDRIDGIGLDRCGAGLFGGLAGIGLARLRFGDVDAARALGERLARTVTGGGRLPGPTDAVGLAHGWSGPALLFVHLHAATDDERWLRLAETALARDLGRCGAPREGRVQVRDGQRWLSTLDRGSAGIGLVLDAYVRRTDDPCFARVRDRIRDGLGTELLLSPGLLDGQAGLLHATAHLTGPGPALAPHLRGLGLHSVRFRGRRPSRSTACCACPWTSPPARRGCCSPCTPRCRAVRGTRAAPRCRSWRRGRRSGCRGEARGCRRAAGSRRVRQPPPQPGLPTPVRRTGVVLLGSGASAIALPLLVLRSTGSPLHVGLVEAVWTGSLALACLPAGPIADRFDRRTVLLLCEAGRAVASAALATAVLTGLASLPVLLVAGAVLGFLTAPFNAAVLPLVREVVPESKLPTALAVNQVRGQAAYLLGPVVGGALFSVGASWPFWLDCASYTVSVCCVLALRVRPGAPPGARRAGGRRSRRGCAFCGANACCGG
ncbi:hypothetical protein SMD44_08766 [Streptomyces alboflavus]|uniref:Multidrug efflux pump Tap n=1 Tax=Streptomyces alboflavus TaxID=67267 RepID=A0A1Z1WSB1_9ACTN|nr:MFS transporter [Streptomyces alboflavus]ARX89279.1 hypothetical protein SMD44_08766 [Streptomyces alboflavus]